MKKIYILLLVLSLIFVFGNIVLADNSTAPSSGENSKGSLVCCKEQGVYPGAVPSYNWNTKDYCAIPKNANGEMIDGVSREIVSNSFCENNSESKKVVGYLTLQNEVTTTMWGTHRLDEGSPCTGEVCTAKPDRIILVKALNNNILLTLKKYENKQVMIYGELSYYDLEGGFWGLVAEKVTLKSSNEVLPVPDEKESDSNTCPVEFVTCIEGTEPQAYKDKENGCTKFKCVARNGFSLPVTGEDGSDIPNSKISITKKKDGSSLIVSQDSLPSVSGEGQIISTVEVTTEKNISYKNQKMMMETSNGEEREVKVLPEQASERAREVLTNIFGEVELKEKEEKVYYEFKESRDGNFLGFIPVQAKYQVEVSAENGEILSVKKPWWNFLFKEKVDEVEVAS